MDQQHDDISQQEQDLQDELEIIEAQIDTLRQKYPHLVAARSKGTPSTNTAQAAAAGTARLSRPLLLDHANVPISRPSKVVSLFLSPAHLRGEFDDVAHMSVAALEGEIQAIEHDLTIEYARMYASHHRTHSAIAEELQRVNAEIDQYLHVIRNITYQRTPVSGNSSSSLPNRHIARHATTASSYLAPCSCGIVPTGVMLSCAKCDRRFHVSCLNELFKTAGFTHALTHRVELRGLYFLCADCSEPPLGVLRIRTIEEMSEEVGTLQDARRVSDQIKETENRLLYLRTLRQQ